MHRLLIALLWLFSMSLYGSEDNPRHAMSVLNETIPALMTEMQIPGVSMGLVIGNNVIHQGFGTSDPGSGQPIVAERDIFRVGSLSKSVTATAVLHLTQNHTIGLHDDLRPLLADLPIRPVLEQPLTLHHLLTHTAGFNEQLFGQHVREPAAFFEIGEYLIRHLPPRFENPGKVIAYNDHHTTIAGWIIEQVSGLPFHEYVDRHIFAPLDMTGSTFNQISLPDNLTQRRVNAWRLDKDAFLSYRHDYIQTTPAAGLYTTASDMTTYVISLLNCENSVLTNELCGEQLASQVKHHPKLAGRAYGFAMTQHDNLRVLYKDGQASGFNARLLLVPEKKLGLFLVHNRNILGRFGQFHDAARFNRRVGNRLLQSLWPTPEVHNTGPEPEPARDASQRIPTYLGDYRNAVAARHNWERIVGMFDDVSVRAGDRDSAVTFGAGDYIEVEPGLVQWQKGGHFFRAFLPSENEIRYLAIGSGAYERIPFYTASWFTPWYVGGTILLLLGFTLWHGRESIRQTGYFHVSGVLIGTMLLAFIGGFGLVLGTTDVQVLFSGPTTAMIILLALPLVSCALLPIYLVTGARGISARGPAANILYAVMVITCALFLGWLYYWNLLGYS